MSPKRKKAAEKKTTPSSTKKAKDQSLSDKIQNLNITKSYTSLAYGIVTVVVLFILVVVGFRTFSNQEKVEITDDSAVTEAQGDLYVVKAGQSLWDIAEEVYGTGFEWERIAVANKLLNPGQLEEGTKLIIPRIQEDDTAMTTTPSPSQEATASPTVAPTTTPTPAVTTTATTAPTATQVPTKVPTKAPTSTPQPTKAPEKPTTGTKIEGNKYIVKEGDTLWDIAVRAHADGYKWVVIFNANKDKISNPDLIFVGQEIVIPRSN